MRPLITATLGIVPEMTDKPNLVRNNFTQSEKDNDQIMSNKKQRKNMKRLISGFLLSVLMSAIGLAQNKLPFYAGVSAGIVMPENLDETWVNTAKAQSAELIHLMNSGYMMGAKLGYKPEALGKFIALELEYNFHKATVERITSSGFIAGKDTIPAFSSEAENSFVQCHSLWINILVRYPSGIAHPYIGLAPGLSFSTIAFHEKHIIGNFGFEETSDDSGFSYQILFGTDFDITSLISFGGGYKYFAVKPKMTWENGTYSDYGYHSHHLFIDIKFKF
jgi:opacity protein-like surface antigen